MGAGCWMLDAGCWMKKQVQKEKKGVIMVRRILVEEVFVVLKSDRWINVGKVCAAADSRTLQLKNKINLYACQH